MGEILWGGGDFMKASSGVPRIVDTHKRIFFSLPTADLREGSKRRGQTEDVTFAYDRLGAN